MMPCSAIKGQGKEEGGRRSWLQHLSSQVTLTSAELPALQEAPNICLLMGSREKMLDFALLVCTSLPHLLNSLSQPRSFSCFCSSYSLPHPAGAGRNLVTACGGAQSTTSGQLQFPKTVDGLGAHLHCVEPPMLRKPRIVGFPSCTCTRCAAHADFCRTSQSLVASCLSRGIVQFTKKSLFPVCQNSSSKCFWLQLVQHYCIRFSEASFSSFNCSVKLQDFWASSSFRRIECCRFRISAASACLCLWHHLCVTSPHFCASFVSSLPAATRFAGNMERSFIIGRLPLCSLTRTFL